jgi:hypothetical protein
VLAGAGTIAAAARRYPFHRSVIVSPLLNLAPATATGATLRQHRRAIPLGNSVIRGEAMLSLTPDRRAIAVRMTLDRPCAATLRLRRLEGSGELLILEIAASGSSFTQRRIEAHFSLDDRRAFAALPADGLVAAGIRLSELRAGSVDGVHVEPAPEPDPGPYLAERMLVEIAAAERSHSAVAASRHVELAILYARELQGGRAA